MLIDIFFPLQNVSWKQLNLGTTCVSPFTYRRRQQVDWSNWPSRMMNYSSSLEYSQYKCKVIKMRPAILVVKLQFCAVCTSVYATRAWHRQISWYWVVQRCIFQLYLVILDTYGGSYEACVVLAVEETWISCYNLQNCRFESEALFLVCSHVQSVHTDSLCCYKPISTFTEVFCSWW